MDQKKQHNKKKYMRIRKTRAILSYRTQRWRKAVLTLEAAFLVPWTFLVTVLLIILLFYFGNRVFYQAAAWEAALAGNQFIAGRTAGEAEENAAGERLAAESAQARIHDQNLPGTAPEMQVSSTKERTEVSFSGQRYPAFSEYFSLQIRESVKKVRPAPLIQNAWVLKETVNRLGGGSFSEEG